MKVKLLKPVLENGVVKTSRRAKVVNGKVATVITTFSEGAELEVSDATGEKYVAAGLAERVVDEPSGVQS